MPEIKPIKEDVRATALNDIKERIKKVIDSNDNEDWNQLIRSLHTADQLGITPESALSAILNAMPTETRKTVAVNTAVKHNLTPRGLDAIQAPED